MFPEADLREMSGAGLIREAGQRWVRERNDGTFLLTLEEAFDLGHRTNALMYGDALMD